PSLPLLRYRGRRPYAGGGYLACWQSLCQGAAARAAGSALVGGTSMGTAPLRTGRRRAQPLLAARAALAGDASDHRCRLDRRPPVGRWQLSPLTGAAGLPCGLAAPAVGLAMSSHPCRGPSYGQPPLSSLCLL
ncbi:hypothetical protein BHM03_00061471, partial [Ensete ventricosum]